MAVTATVRRRQTNQNHPEIRDRTTAFDHAVRMIYRVCCLAGSANLIDKIRVDLEPARRQEMMEKTGRRTVPQIYIGNRHVGGYDDLVALDRAGELAPLLAAEPA